MFLCSPPGPESYDRLPLLIADLPEKDRTKLELTAQLGGASFPTLPQADWVALGFAILLIARELCLGFHACCIGTLLI